MGDCDHVDEHPDEAARDVRLHDGAAGPETGPTHGDTEQGIVHSDFPLGQHGESGCSRVVCWVNVACKLSQSLHLQLLLGLK